MKGRKLEGILYLLLAFMLIFWEVFPAVSAFAYITPGTPIQGGTFIIPLIGFGRFLYAIYY
ncbi:hypothetical protein NSS89_15100 [Caldifermentibacillus hisashii]|uniref:hypothetical protein n=1 Tax=Caldifermentibacillus hisashii TaxID=996558 RepID=UPI000BA30549|nr:hypothetical protein [Caldifermentibacillus hisashii]MDL0421672.1 hypothetical protein [Caldibacillus thermoamylovorans]PAC31876.1 hypothetical protein CEJ87_17485 [Caldifermentibacillus hisashii]